MTSSGVQSKKRIYTGLQTSEGILIAVGDILRRGYRIIFITRERRAEYDGPCLRT